MITRRRIEDAIDTLIEFLDQLDGDADFEVEPFEEQHDREFDQAEDGIADKTALLYVIAEMSRRKRRRFN